MDDTQKTGEIVLNGKPIAPGIGIGIAWCEELIGVIPRYYIDHSAIEAELGRFHHALDVVKGNLKEHIKTSRKRIAQQMVMLNRKMMHRK